MKITENGVIALLLGFCQLHMGMLAPYGKALYGLKDQNYPVGTTWNICYNRNVTVKHMDMGCEHGKLFKSGKFYF